MNEIRIDIGVCTVLNINLTNVDFTDIEKIIFTVKNFPTVDSPVIIEREFTEPKLYKVIVKPEESLKLAHTAEFDFNKVLTDGTRLKMDDNGKVVLRKGVGDCID